MACLAEVHHPLVADLVHVRLGLPGVGLLDADEGGAEGDRTEPAVEEEQALVRVHPGYLGLQTRPAILFG